MAKQHRTLHWGQIYDNLYGFVRLTETEERIINSPYYQRLRWIKQLGFANYIFPGAEHTRFAHAIGVMHSVDQMIRAIGKEVPDERLFNKKSSDSASIFHKSCRLAALLHDIGTFPFSHSIEESYIRFGQKLEKKGKLPGKRLPNSHEHLGSFIIKNTDFDGGITRILEDGGIDSASLSKYIKGEAQDMVANQLLHSDLDADRMDYLVRDAHHTGIKYGHIDRDYILYHLTTFTGPGGKEMLGLGEKAVHAVEDFLLARFSWYSQVVKNSSSAKYDVLAAHVASKLLEKGLIIRFHELLEQAGNDPERFMGFNDVYFMSLVQNLYWDKKIKDPIINEQMRMLIYRIPPHTLRLPEFKHRILPANDEGRASKKDSVIRGIRHKLDEIHALFKKKGTGKEWVIADIPARDVVFAKGGKNALTQRDPIKIVDGNGGYKALADADQAVISNLTHHVNFIPNVYANEAAVALLKANKILKK